MLLVVSVLLLPWEKHSLKCTQKEEEQNFGHFLKIRYQQSE